MIDDDNSNPPAPPNQHLADALESKARDRLRRQARRFVSQRSSVDTFKEFNTRRAEKGLPPVWPTAWAKTTDTPQ